MDFFLKEWSEKLSEEMMRKLKFMNEKALTLQRIRETESQARFMWVETESQARFMVEINSGVMTPNFLLFTPPWGRNSTNFEPYRTRCNYWLCYIVLGNSFSSPEPSFLIWKRGGGKNALTRRFFF